jgi:hypothetical protein
MAGHNGRSVLLLGGQRLAGVGVFGDRLRLPLLDGGDAGVGAAFVFYDRIAGEAPRYGVAIELVAREVCCDRLGKLDRNVRSPSFR